jgi:hypothetical protein
MADLIRRRPERAIHAARWCTLSGSGGRMVHLNMKPESCRQTPNTEPAEARQSIYGSALKTPSPSHRCVFESDRGGGASVGFRCYQHAPSERIGVMVAANSGRPGGACGMVKCVDNIHARHSTQEEDMVSNWMLSEAGTNSTEQTLLYVSTICRSWGMEQPEHSTSPRTLQGIDYTGADYPAFYADAWVVPDAYLSAKLCHGRLHYFAVDEHKFPATLIFAAGPNASGSRGGRKAGSMARTLNRKASRRDEYSFFRECVKETGE